MKNATYIDDSEPHFRLVKLDHTTSPALQHHRPGCYSCYFIRGAGHFQYKRHRQTVTGPALVLLDARLPCRWEHTAGAPQGWLFTFSEAGLPRALRSHLHRLPLFFQQGHGPFLLNARQDKAVVQLYEKIDREMATPYRFRNELLAVLALQLMHYVVKHFAG